MSSTRTFPKFKDFRTTRSTSKLWITPENDLVPLHSFHFEYFRNPHNSLRYGVPFGKEVPTRLAALAVGFARVNYERNGGLLTVETIRWDEGLRYTVNQLVLANLDAIDRVRLNLVDANAQLIRFGVLALQDLRRDGLTLNESELRSWNDFPTVTL